MEANIDNIQAIERAEPQIIVGGIEGHHNADLKAKQYRDLSTVMVVPTRGQISARVAENWMGLIAPMNQPFYRIFIPGLEVGHAYNVAVRTILDHPILSKARFLLTIEEDNLVPPDALLRLLERLEGDELRKGDLAAVGALYWTKGYEGQPMCYGPEDKPNTFAPFISNPDGLNYCNGLGMGCTLFRMDLFREMPEPWFETLNKWDPATGTETATQDLNFCQKVRGAGFRLACDATVKVGHLDNEGIVW